MLGDSRPPRPPGTGGGVGEDDCSPKDGDAAQLAESRRIDRWHRRCRSFCRHHPVSVVLPSRTEFGGGSSRPLCIHVALEQGHVVEPPRRGGRARHGFPGLAGGGGGVARPPPPPHPCEEGERVLPCADGLECSSRVLPLLRRPGSRSADSCLL